MKRARGFTLLEVIVAVAILAIAMGAIISGMASHASNAGELRDRTVALWVAHNRMSEIELAPEWPDTGRSDGDVKMGGAEWRWFAEIKDTEDPELRRVDLRVRLQGGEADLAKLSGFISKSGRQ